MDVPYKCIIMGDAKCGKTTFLRRHQFAEFKKEYVPTDRFETNVDTLIFKTTRGPIRFDVWDWGKEDKELERYPVDFYKDSRCAILMFDLAAADAFDTFPNYAVMMEQFCADIPIAICGNKADIKADFEFELKPETFLGCGTDPEDRIYSEISVKTNSNINGPFLYLARSLFKDFKLEFVKLPPLMLPPPVSLASALAKIQVVDRKHV
ncbi:GTP-binding nuclear protein Ran, testis-specific isoform-like [Drosophila obscura]|uniref:GTP-binding nuclear protein Ran, testis-specific isoform-like n=1 Tax=Drosophila obscura TaxID=7282 RepID=UPI001BB26998|nr:GTP-binding nuclear protein Ran, testis-specific isoform-like [Drosophila obscura]